MPLQRPPRAPVGALNERVRRAIIVAADRHGLPASVILNLHSQAEHIGCWADLVADVEERYRLKPESLLRRVDNRRQTAARVGGPVSPRAQQEIDAESVLHVLPDAEFLSALENVIDIGRRERLAHSETLVGLLGDIDGALRAHGCAYQHNLIEWKGFEWIGDPAHHELVVKPALMALADPRVVGPRGEFEEALRKRRAGTPTDFEDAIDEAAKSVESILQVLHHELGVGLPAKRQLSSLFSNLIEKGPAGKVPPGYVDHLVLAAGGPRNLTSHGQGATVREVPDELANASIAAAATAITLLAHYLP